MANGWRMGRPFTDCGNGSLPEATANLRSWLPLVVDQYQIQSINDAGAGDLAWLKLIKTQDGRRWMDTLTYRGFDLIPRAAGIQQWDITKHQLPYADAILCRMVLNHLQERIKETMPLLKASGAKYLFATQYDAGFNRVKEFQRLDLRLYLGDPIQWCYDGGDEFCKLAMWKLD